MSGSWGPPLRVRNHWTLPSPKRTFCPRAPVIRTVAVLDGEEILVAGLIGNHGDVRRMHDLKWARMPGRMEIANVVGIVPAEHALVARRIVSPDVLALIEAHQLGIRPVKMLSVTGAIQQRRVVEHTSIVQDRRERPGRGIGPVGRGIGQERVQRCVLPQAVAELLEVEQAAGLVHPLAGALDGRQQRSGRPR